MDTEFKINQETASGYFHGNLNGKKGVFAIASGLAILMAAFTQSSPSAYLPFQKTPGNTSSRPLKGSKYTLH